MDDLDSLIGQAVDADAAESAKSGHKEVPGDFDGYVLDEAGTLRGHIEMDVPNGKITFHWTDATSAWPASFTLEAPKGRALPSTAHSETFAHQSFSGSGSTHDVSGCQYELRVGSTVYGWMHYDSAGTTWYAVPSELTTDGLYDATSLEFVAHTAGTVTAVKLYDAAL